VSSRDHGQCLTDETLTEYLDGSLDVAIKAASEVHLVSCEQCRNQLAFFMRVLQPDLTATEMEALRAIESAWKEKTGSQRMPERRLRLPRLFVGLTAAAAAVIVSVISAWIVKERLAEPKSAGEVVELLLAQNRPFESQISGEPYRAILRTRGSADPGISYSLLAGEMTRLSANSHDMGRFYLLQKDFGRAIPYLEMAEREVGAAPAVHNDLGVAYLESGDASQTDNAGREFRHALNQDRSFATAVFNLALFYERTNATAEADAQWKRYLELDSKSDWAAEARERLQGLSH
jgi:tetratricopeptide (TPR) repeat protein